MTDYCRLCAEIKDPDEIVASISDAEQSMEQKLRACCCWTTENTEQHRLPHSVCAICLDRLDKCWLFSQSVQLAQQRLLELFGNETETETVADTCVEMVEIEIKPLASEIAQTDYDCLNYSNSLPSSPQHHFNPEKSKEVNPLESNDTETKKFGGTIHKCPVCGKCFQKRWNFTEHMRTHTDERPFECSLCHKKFRTKRNLRVHCLLQLENKCEICLREFCTTIQLNEHKKSPCEPPTLDQNHSIARFVLNRSAVEYFNRDEHRIGIESSAQMENRIDQPIAMAAMPHDSHAQFASIVDQMQKLNEPFLMPKKSTGSYECDECGRVFAKKFNWTQHRMTHSDERPFECWLCHKMCRTKAHMKKHLEIHTTCLKIRKSIDQARKRAKLIELYGDGELIDFNQLKYKCHECGKVFQKLSNLKGHCATHSNERPFECTLCHKTFKLMKALKAHVKLHLCPRKPSVSASSATPTEPNWICEQCGKAFRHKITLNEHMQGAHSDERPYKCDTCDGTFKTWRSLITHRRVTHTGHRFNCTHCDKSFRFKQSLKRHLERNVGTVAKPFRCDMCGKAYPSKSLLKEHIRVHTGEKPFACDRCGTSFSTKAYVNRHMKDVHGISRAFQREKPAHDSYMDPTLPNTEPILSFKCITCGLGYKSQILLQRHQESHTEIQHKCSQCDRKFRKKHSLKLHMETHSGVINKPHVCDVCGKGFRQKFELREHQRIHTGEKPYTCEHCASNFRTMASFYSHLTKIHGISMSARNREERARATAQSASMAADQQSQFSN